VGVTASDVIEALYLDFRKQFTVATAFLTTGSLLEL